MSCGKNKVSDWRISVDLDVNIVKVIGILIYKLLPLQFFFVRVVLRLSPVVFIRIYHSNMLLYSILLIKIGLNFLSIRSHSIPLSILRRILLLQLLVHLIQGIIIRRPNRIGHVIICRILLFIYTL